MLYQLNYTHHRERWDKAGKLVRLKFVRRAVRRGRAGPRKVPYEEGEPMAKPDSRQGELWLTAAGVHPKG